MLLAYNNIPAHAVLTNINLSWVKNLKSFYLEPVFPQSDYMPATTRDFYSTSLEQYDIDALCDPATYDYLAEKSEVLGRYLKRKGTSLSLIGYWKEDDFYCADLRVSYVNREDTGYPMGTLLFNALPREWLEHLAGIMEINVADYLVADFKVNSPTEITYQALEAVAIPPPAGHAYGDLTLLGVVNPS